MGTHITEAGEKMFREDFVRRAQEREQELTRLLFAVVSAATRGIGQDELYISDIDLNQPRGARLCRRETANPGDYALWVEHGNVPEVIGRIE